MGVKLNFSKYLEFLYLKAFINIISNKTTTKVYIEMLNHKGVIVKSAEENFETSTINHQMKDFIKTYIQETPYYYISTLDYSPFQGAVSSVKKADDQNDSTFRSYEDRWSYNTPKTNIIDMKNRYEDIGLDFLFSPFPLIANFFKEKISDTFTMYVLLSEDYLTLTIFKHSELIYARHIEILIENINDDIDELDLGLNLSSDEENDDDGFDEIEDIDEEDSIDLDDFGDIEDLDTIEEIEEFSEDEEVEESSEELEDIPNESIDSFNKDYQRFTLLQETINSYYHDSRYEREFIETIYIADGIGVSPDLKKYLEEEMFLDVYVRHIDLASEICEMAKMELK